MKFSKITETFRGPSQGHLFDKFLVGWTVQEKELVGTYYDVIEAIENMDDFQFVFVSISDTLYRIEQLVKSVMPKEVKVYRQDKSVIISRIIESKNQAIASMVFAITANTYDGLFVTRGPNYRDPGRQLPGLEQSAYLEQPGCDRRRGRAHGVALGMDGRHDQADVLTHKAAMDERKRPRGYACGCYQRWFEPPGVSGFRWGSDRSRWGRGGRV